MADKVKQRECRVSLTPPGAEEPAIPSAWATVQREPDEGHVGPEGLGGLSLVELRHSYGEQGHEVGAGWQVRAGSRVLEVVEVDGDEQRRLWCSVVEEGDPDEWPDEPEMGRQRRRQQQQQPPPAAQQRRQPESQQQEGQQESLPLGPGHGAVRSAASAGLARHQPPTAATPAKQPQQPQQQQLPQHEAESTTGGPSAPAGSRGGGTPAASSTSTTAGTTTAPATTTTTGGGGDSSSPGPSSSTAGAGAGEGD